MIVPTVGGTASMMNGCGTGSVDSGRRSNGSDWICCCSVAIEPGSSGWATGMSVPQASRDIARIAPSPHASGPAPGLREVGEQCVIRQLAFLVSACSSVDRTMGFPGPGTPDHLDARESRAEG